MTWSPLSQPQDYILLAHRKSPGIAEVVGASSVRNWDERKGYGLDGAFAVYRGRGLTKFSVVIRLYSEQDWADWYAWKTIVDRVPTKRGGTSPAAGYLDIEHPILEALGVKAAAVQELMQPEQTDDGEWTIEIKFLEARFPKFALATPEGSAATEVDPYEVKIQGLSDQWDKLAGP